VASGDWYNNRKAIKQFHAASTPGEGSRPCQKFYQAEPNIIIGILKQNPLLKPICPGGSYQILVMMIITSSLVTDSELFQISSEKLDRNLAAKLSQHPRYRSETSCFVFVKFKSSLS
jgi:hypothetical protein